MFCVQNRKEEKGEKREAEDGTAQTRDLIAKKADGRAIHEEGSLEKVSDVKDKTREESQAWLFEIRNCPSRIWLSDGGGFAPQRACYNI